MTFILNSFFFSSESVFLFPENATSTANRTAEKQTHVVDACFWPLPLTTTQNDWLEPMQENERSD